MNQALWDKILAFDFENSSTEYGFSTRLAHENYWTKQFTEQAILEYKKFMYLAATSDFMVSPSEIIDKVWHQHLIFTQSYQDFCHILGKQIQHIPSTHDKEEFEKFKLAKERTLKFYERDFGKQPPNIWIFDGMFESLHLEKAKFNLRTFVIFGILIGIGLTIPAYFLLKPIYIHIDNPQFILSLIFLTFFILLALELYNKHKLKNIVSGFDASSFIFELQPFELIYLKTQKLSNIINGIVNELIVDGTIQVNSDHTIALIKSSETKSKEHQQVITELSEFETIFYPYFLKRLVTKPVIYTIQNSMDAFVKYVNKSKKFGRLFYTNFAVLTFLLILSFLRIVTGVFREKPVVQILIATVIIGIIFIVFLIRLTQQIAKTTIPDLYKEKILSSAQIDNNWQWNYFLLGRTALATSFVPLVNYTETNHTNSSGCGTSCGSSCGSSCSSCGGCGGD